MLRRHVGLLRETEREPSTNGRRYDVSDPLVSGVERAVPTNGRRYDVSDSLMGGVERAAGANGSRCDVTDALLGGPDGAARANLRRYDAGDGLMSDSAVVTMAVSVRTVDDANDWKELAHVLDRLFFWVVFLAMSASAMIIMLVPFYKEDTNQ